MSNLTIGSRLKHAWNAFLNRSPTEYSPSIGPTYIYKPDRARFTRTNEKSILVSVLNRIAMDAAAIQIRHVKLDENDRFLEIVKSGLDYCINIEANKDQTGRNFLQDIYMSLLDEGCVAIVPVDTDIDPVNHGNYSINSMRTAKILQWGPDAVQVYIYDDRSGQKKEIWIPKSMVAIVENPLYAVLNEPNSILQRLKRKLNLLDIVDEQLSSEKMNIIIQLPYSIKTESKQKQAESRRESIETQLVDSKYGIAYIDGTEKITQLNRPIENNLLDQVKYMTDLFFSQIGVTQEILDGTADEKTMINYYNRLIEPIVSAVVDAMKVKFLTKTARTQRQSILFFRDPFKLVPVSELAEIADKMTRNEIMSSNEFRQVIGLKPSSDPSADELRNKNLNQEAGAEAPPQPEKKEEEIQNG